MLVKTDKKMFDSDEKQIFLFHSLFSQLQMLFLLYSLYTVLSTLHEGKSGMKILRFLSWLLLNEK